MSSCSSKRALVYLANSLLPNPGYYAAGFSSASHKIKGGTTPGNLKESDRREAVAGTEGGGYAGFPSVDNKATLEKSDGGEDAAEKAKQGIVGAVEKGLEFGEMTKQTMDGMWDAVKKTADGITSAVADDNENQQQSTQISNKHEADKHVEDLRRRAGGYDLKDR